jgi:hypothetical protein
MEQADQLAVLAGGGLMLTTDRAWRAELGQPDIHWFPAVVSADGEFVAWAPKPSKYPPPGSEERVILTDGTTAPMAIHVDGFPSPAIAIASGGQRVAMALTKSRTRRLVVIGPAAGYERDVTSLVPRLNLGGIQRIRLSNNGDRLLVGGENTFYLIDVPSSTVLINRDARNPSLSPAGSRVAFPDEVGIAIQGSRANSIERIETGGRIDFVSGWSPNGRFLLAGGVTRSRFRLIVIDLKEKVLAEILDQDDEMSSEFYWIKKRFGSLPFPP